MPFRKSQWQSRSHSISCWFVSVMAAGTFSSFQMNFLNYWMKVTLQTAVQDKLRNHMTQLSRPTLVWLFLMALKHLGEFIRHIYESKFLSVPNKWSCRWIRSFIAQVTELNGANRYSGNQRCEDWKFYKYVRVQSIMTMPQIWYFAHAKRQTRWLSASSNKRCRVILCTLLIWW